MILRITAGGFKDAENARVEDGDDLGQSGENGHLPNTRKKLAKYEVHAALDALGLAVYRGGADAGTFQIVALSTASPWASKNGKTSRSMFGPVVGKSLKEPQYCCVSGLTETRYSGFRSSKASRSYPFFTTTFQPRRVAKVRARFRNIASISPGNNRTHDPGISLIMLCSSSSCDDGKLSIKSLVATRQIRVVDISRIIFGCQHPALGSPRLRWRPQLPVLR